MIVTFFDFYDFYVRNKVYLTHKEWEKKLRSMIKLNSSEASIFAADILVKLMYDRAIKREQEKDENCLCFRNFIQSICLYYFLLDSEYRLTTKLSSSYISKNPNFKVLGKLIISGWSRGFNVLEYIYVLFRKTDSLFISETDVLEGIKEAEKFHNLGNRLQQDWIYLKKLNSGCARWKQHGCS